MFEAQYYPAASFGKLDPVKDYSNTNFDENTIYQGKILMKVVA